MKKTAYILIGPSGSGKSTTVQELKKQHEGQDVGVFSLDTCRLAYYAIHGQPNGIMAGRLLMREMKFNFPTDRDELVKFYSEAFDFCNARGKDFDQFVTENWIDTRNHNDVVIIDNTNVTRKSRARWISDLRGAKTANQFGFHIVAIEFMVPLDTLIARQSSRPDKSIPLSAVRQQYFRQEAALLGSECDEVRVVRSVDREVTGDSEELTIALKSHNKYVNEQAAK